MGQDGQPTVSAQAINACLRRVVQMDGEAVLTTEGLGSADALHPIQKSMVQHAATQCGYCTPGWVMSMYGLLSNGAKPTVEQIESYFDGNLCRCTGYRPILASMRALAPDPTMDPNAKACQELAAARGGNCSDEKEGKDTTALRACGKGDGAGCSSDAKSACHSKGIGCGVSHGTVCSPDIEELVFDPKNPSHKVDAFACSKKPAGTGARQVKASKSMAAGSPLWWTSNARTLFISPSSIADVHKILSYFRDSNNSAPKVPLGGVNDISASALGREGREVIRLQVGATSEGVTKYYRFNGATDAPTVVVDLTRLPELRQLRTDATGITAHAAVTLNELRDALDASVSSSPALKDLSIHIGKVASNSIRAVASWAGNLALAKAHPDFPSDMLTILAGVGAVLTLQTAKGTREVPVVQWLDVQLEADELIRSIHVPFHSAKNSLVRTFKTRSRHQLAHPIVNAAFRVHHDGATPAAIVYGGVIDGLFTPTKTAQLLGNAGKTLTEQSMKSILVSLKTEVDAALVQQVQIDNKQRKPIACVAAGQTVTQSVANAPFERLRPSKEYVVNLVINLMFKFLVQMRVAMSGSSAEDEQSYIYSEWIRPLSSGLQDLTNASDPSLAPLGLPISKTEADIQATGEAEYADDAKIAGSGLVDADGDSNPTGALFAAFFWSTIAKGKIIKIDATEALRMPGVLRLITAEDIRKLGGFNECGQFSGDEEVFASNEVGCVGQAIGMIVAETRFQAEQAATLVQVTYGPPEIPPILTMDEAINAKHFLPDKPDEGQEKTPTVVAGNPDAALEKSEHRVSGSIRCSGQYHFCMEPQTTTVVISKDGASDGHVDVWSSCQGVHPVREAVARAIGRPSHRVTVHMKRAGGGFGSKLARDVPNAVAAAVCAAVMRRPMKVQQSRYSEQQMVGRRPPFRSDYSVGFSSNGRIHAIKQTFYFQGGQSYDINEG